MGKRLWEQGTGDKAKAVLFLSSSFDAINQAMADGLKIEDLSVIGLVINVPEGYLPY